MQTGKYQVNFTIPGTDDPPTTSITVHVVNCGLGDVTSVTGDACQTCEKGYYSLDPRNNTCDICVPNAECSGGAAITPAPEFWHSSPRSIQMHRSDNDICQDVNVAPWHIIDNVYIVRPNIMPSSLLSDMTYMCAHMVVCDE